MSVEMELIEERKPKGEEDPRYVYTYEKRASRLPPPNNATYRKPSNPEARNAPLFEWHNSGEKQRELTIWIRAKKKSINPEYKRKLADERAKLKAELNSLTGLLSSMSMATNGRYESKNAFVQGLRTGVLPNTIRKQRETAQEAAQKATQLNAEIAEIDSLLEELKELKFGGKRKKYTKKRSHKKQRKTYKNRK
jgi:hypothetical protein